MHEIDTERFTGFAELYDEARPKPPGKVTELLLGYLNAPRAEHVVDLGCGTGLSTAVWLNRADRITGVEPNGDMLKKAREAHPSIRFTDGSSYDTRLPAECADIVTCSQSFHWMEPRSTIAEVSRILRPGGLFAAYDCSWPVSWAWEGERAWEELFEAVENIEASQPGRKGDDGKYPKSRHLENLKNSGAFRYARKLFFDNAEACDAERFIRIALSQGRLQNLLKAGISEIRGPLERFERTVRSQRNSTMTVSYVIILGVK